MTGRVAVCVDGENIGGTHAEAICEIAKRHGRIDILRVYGDVTVIKTWHDADGYQLVHSGTGKNATDVLLSVDAISLALKDGFDTVVVASSDGDFTHLAQHLRSCAVAVVGVGEQKARQRFRAACTQFQELGHTSENSTLDHQIKSVIAKHSKNGQGMRFKDLNPVMRNSYQTKISNFPERTWRAYLSARPHLFALDPRGPEARVRFLPAGFSGG